MRNRIKLPLWLLASYLAVCSGLAIFLVHVTLHPNRRPLPPTAEVQVRSLAAKLDSQVEDVEILASDGAPLDAWYVYSAKGNGNATLLLHGVGDNRLGTLGYAQILLAHGYDVLMPDARAHGMSGGRLATYGLRERDDIHRWLEWLKARQHPSCIFGFAESMGAAQLLQALGTQPYFCAVIAESSFSSFREIAYDRMGQQFHCGPWVGRTVLRPVVEIALAYARSKYHLNLANASPAYSVAHSQVPVLLIHGEIDSNIPVRHSRALQHRNPKFVLWEVPGADHCGAISTAPRELEKTMLAWFGEHLNAPTALSSSELIAK